MAEDRQVTILGCGAIGLPLAVALASRGLQVLGIDTDGARLSGLIAGDVTEAESELRQALASQLSAGRLSFDARLQPLSVERAFVIAVPTPVDERRAPDMGLLFGAFDDVLDVAQDGDLVVLRSTVPAGTTRALAAKAAERGRHLLFVHCPDRSLEGHGFRDQFAVPNLTGALTETAGRAAELIFSRLGAVEMLNSPEESELAKLFCNVQRDVSFALANQFALICDELGVRYADVARAAARGYDRFVPVRAGPVGGPCLPKDAYLLAQSVGCRSDLVGLPLEARRVNESLLGRVVASITRFAGGRPRPSVAVLGTAFKGQPRTNDERGSFGLLLAATLRAELEGAAVTAWDPDIRGPDRADTIEAAVRDADVVVIANDHPALRAPGWHIWARAMRAGGLIVDTCSGLAEKNPGLPNGVTLLALGGGASMQAFRAGSADR